MKRIIIGLMVSSSASAFSQESEFERGYGEGRASCKSAQEAWLCTIPDSRSETIINSGQGPTRAEAVLNIGSSELSRSLELGYKLNCRKL